MPRALVIDHLAKSFRAGIAGCSARVSVLRDVSLSVERGEAVSILGGPGAGKSALLLCAAGLLRPDAGAVTWFDRGGRALQRPSGVALVHGRPSVALHQTVRETLERSAWLHPRRLPGSVHHRAAEALERIGLGGRADAPVGELDAVSRLRLTIAHALAGVPHTLLLDDPFATLPPASRSEGAAMLRALHAHGTTLVLVSRERLGVGGAPGRELVLDRGHLAAAPAHAVLPPAVLELEVAAPHEADRLLRAHLPQVERLGTRLRVPLARATAEEVLAYCRANHIVVRASRVVS